MAKISCETESRKSKEFMDRPKKTEPDETKKSEGQFSGFKDHIANLNPGLYHLIRGERTFLDALEAISPDMRSILEREFRKYTGRQNPSNLFRNSSANTFSPERRCLLKQSLWRSIKIVIMVFLSSGLASYIHWEALGFDPISEIQELRDEGQRDEALMVIRFLKERRSGEDQEVIKALEDELDQGLVEKAKSVIWNGCIKGEVYDTYSGMSSVSADLTRFGDLRDLLIQTWKRIRGDPCITPPSPASKPRFFAVSLPLHEGRLSSLHHRQNQRDRGPRQRPDALIAPEMEHFGKIFGVQFISHEVGDADRKARVERNSSYAERNFLAGRLFRDWHDLNAQARQ